MTPRGVHGHGRVGPPQTEKQRQKEVEFACIEAVARAVGCKAIPEDEARRWPDGWLEHADGKQEPAEVVRAFRRPPGEDPRDGSSWMRHSRDAAHAARVRSEETGKGVSWHVGDDGFVLLEEETVLPWWGTVLPLATTPIKQGDWVLAAVHQKVAKNYGFGTHAVLIVQIHSPWPLPRFELERLAEVVRALGSRFKFAALWIVSNYGDPPVKVPV